MVLSLLGEKFKLNDNHKKYVKLRNMYMDYAVDYSDQFRNNFGGRYRNIDSLINYANDDIHHILYSMIEGSSELFNALGIYDMDVKSFAEYCEDYIGLWDETFEELLTQYNNLKGIKKEAKDYRKFRKESRSKFVGGGFGISGALKGAAKAGALNATTGIAHSFANAIGNAATSADIGSKLNKLFNSSEMRDALEGSLYSDIFSIHYAIVDVLNERLDYNIQCYDLNREKSDIIYKNLLQERVPDNKVVEAITKMLTLFPFSYDYYELALEYFDDEDGEIEQFAEYFGVDIGPLLEDN